MRRKVWVMVLPIENWRKTFVWLENCHHLSLWNMAYLCLEYRFGLKTFSKWQYLCENAINTLNPVLLSWRADGDVRRLGSLVASLTARNQFCIFSPSARGREMIHN